MIALRRKHSVIVFGWFARGDAVAESNIDVVMVRPDSIDEDDEEWADALESGSPPEPARLNSTSV